MWACFKSINVWLWAAVGPPCSRHSSVRQSPYFRPLRACLSFPGYSFTSAPARFRSDRFHCGLYLFPRNMDVFTEDVKATPLWVRFFFSAAGGCCAVPSAAALRRRATSSPGFGLVWRRERTSFTSRCGQRTPSRTGKGIARICGKMNIYSGLFSLFFGLSVLGKKPLY